MRKGFLQKVQELELEEKILNGASLVALICVFFPWVGGEWLGGKTITYNGFGFFTSFMGLAIFVFHLTILSVTIVPLLGGPEIIKRGRKDLFRFVTAVIASILTICVWSVLTKFTFEFSRLDIHFGLYITLVGSLVATLYTFLNLQDKGKPRMQGPSHDHSDPPTAPEIEDHRLR